MKNETLKRIMDAMYALATVAEAVGGLRVLLPVGQIDGLAREVNGLSKTFLDGAMMAGNVTSAPETVTPAAKAVAAKTPKAVKAPKVKRAYVRKDKLGEPTGAAKPVALPILPAEKPKGYSAQGVCVICGKTYLKRSPVQKTCSPECTAEKNKAYARDKYAEKADPAAAPADRLARIKAADKRLDTIPE